LNWSPEQIAGLLKRKYHGEERNQVSHETIYRSLFVQARGVLKKELMQYLRSKRTIRRSRYASLKRDGLGQIKDAVSIRERPASVEDRAVPRHWEGDLIGGSGNSYIATLVERHSRYVMLVKVANKDTQSVVEALKGDALLEQKNAFDQLSPPADDDREYRLFLGSALETALRAEFGAEHWKRALEAYQRSSGNA